VFKALELGAVDFIAKPTRTISDELLRIQQDLQQKVRNVFNLNMAVIKKREALPAAASITAEIVAKRKKKLQPSSGPGKKEKGIELVAIGSSTGGPPALQRIFSSYTEVMPFSVVVSQHMPAGFTKAFAERLNRSSAFEIKEAGDGDRVEPGKILIAPGGRNLVFQAVNGGVVARVVEPSPQDRYIPCVDAMFASLAPIYGAKLLAVVLTGMGNDGSRGIRAVKAAGGQILVEAEESSVVFGMPREAINTGLVDKVAPLERIAREIVLRCGIAPTFE
jgi:two-component system chemotaxis response regulator CheB